AAVLPFLAKIENAHWGVARQNRVEPGSLLRKLRTLLIVCRYRSALPLGDRHARPGGDVHSRKPLLGNREYDQNLRRQRHPARVALGLISGVRGHPVVYRLSAKLRVSARRPDIAPSTSIPSSFPSRSRSRMNSAKGGCSRSVISRAVSCRAASPALMLS